MENVSIDYLVQIEFSSLKEMLEDPTIWKSVDVNYHPPRVERLWTQIGENRLFLHVIHPCLTDDALYHPHPWPSAVHVVAGGCYETGLGFRQDGKIHQISKMLLCGHNYYEMLDPKGWHYVRPVSHTCLSVMLTGKPWMSWEWDVDLPKPEGKMPELSEERKREILIRFADHLSPQIGYRK